MKNKLFIFLFATVFISCSSYNVTSPDGSLALKFQLTNEGAPEYMLLRDGQSVMDWSRLGLVTEQACLGKGFTIIGSSQNSSNEIWETVWGEERFIRDNHNEMTVRLRSGDGMRMDIVFRCFNDGFAFRYVFPEQEMDSLTIIDDLSSFNFAADHNAWFIPWRTEYYEGLWERKPLSEIADTMCSPITMELADGGYAFVHEAALYDYPAQNLYMRDGQLRVFLTPWLDENANMLSAKAYITLPFSTPWHFVSLTRTLPELTASRIMLNLNEPCKIEDTSWIHPMKFMGIWWGMHIKTMTWEAGPKHGATTANMEKYLLFAKQHGIDAVLAEGWNLGWEDWKHFVFTEPYPDWDMDYLSALSDSLGVAIVGHNETGGNAADYERDLDTIYRYHNKYGIHAIKTGYVSPIITTLDGKQLNKGQSGVRHYRKVIETAVKYHIAIDNHEPVMPTGLQRTYPNLMTQEGVRGQEWNAWSTDGGSPCEHVTVLPYTRILAGPVDYTPGVFCFENPIIPTTRVHSTLMSQLGLFVCFYSPLQMACDLPENYTAHADAFRFIEQVPCDWEQSLLVDGRIGDYCIYARQGRGSETWYLGGITDEEPREAVVPLNMLDEDAEYTLTLWRDGDDADWETNPYSYETEHRIVSAGDTLYINMASGGGFAAVIEKSE